MKKVVGLLACVGMLSLQIWAVSPPVMAADAQESSIASEGAGEVAPETTTDNGSEPSLPADAQAEPEQVVVEQIAVDPLPGTLDVLNTFYQKFASLVPSTYSAASWQPMADALAQANGLLQNPQNATVDAAQAALNALLAAENGLQFAPATSLLRETIALAQAQIAQPSQYVRATVNRLDQVLAQANALLAGGEPSQEQITAMVESIVNATSSLVYIPDNLESTRQAAETILANKEQYIPSTVAALDESLNQLQAVYANPNLSQAELDQATAALAAQTGEVRRPASKEALKGGNFHGDSQTVLAQTGILPDIMEPVIDYAAQNPADSVASPVADAMDAIPAPEAPADPEQPQLISPVIKDIEMNSVAGLATGTDRMMAATPAMMEPHMNITDAAITPTAQGETSDTLPLVAVVLVAAFGLCAGLGYTLIARKNKKSQ